ncbi:hypothetical protein SNEBB_004784 [Seison nebaliae]|nr:hypothetical protein SNEBB_004784 [Seison nebaliae]
MLENDTNYYPLVTTQQNDVSSNMKSTSNNDERTINDIKEQTTMSTTTNSLEQAEITGTANSFTATTSKNPVILSSTIITDASTKTTKSNGIGTSKAITTTVLALNESSLTTTATINAITTVTVSTSFMTTTITNCLDCSSITTTIITITSTTTIVSN